MDGWMDAIPMGNRRSVGRIRQQRRGGAAGSVLTASGKILLNEISKRRLKLCINESLRGEILVLCFLPTRIAIAIRLFNSPPLPVFSQMDHLASSPFLTEEFNAPSPASIHFDISPDFDFPNDNPNHFPHTPSYNGSYQNSPYSVLSDLPPTFDNDYDNPSGITITEEYSEYDPAEYDLDNNSTHLLNFGDAFLDNQTVSVSVTPPTFDDSQHPYDHSSPASSTGMDDDRRSRASSTSSYHHPASPQLDLPTNFETLRFESPRWPSDQLPHDRPSPPAQKPQSPPQLLIPDATSPPPTALEPPLINAPDGDGLINAGPRLQIVPATPVSGRESNVQNVPFAQSNPMDHGTPIHHPPSFFAHLPIRYHSSFRYPPLGPVIPVPRSIILFLPRINSQRSIFRCPHFRSPSSFTTTPRIQPALSSTPPSPTTKTTCLLPPSPHPTKSQPL